MTVAICIKCGSIKHGAFNPCNECNLRPETETEAAYSLVLSSHHYSVDALEAMSQNVRRGGALPSLSMELEQKFIGASKELLQDFGNLLGLPPGGKQPKFIFDHARLMTDHRQPAAYPTPECLREFAEDTEQEKFTRRVNLTFQMPDQAEFVLKNADWQWVKRALAVTLFTPLGTITSHLNFSTPSEGSVQAITFHELVHIYRTRGLFLESEWKQLLHVARQLGVMQLSINDFLGKTNSVAADTQSRGTLASFYASEYQGRALYQELMDQEGVAHLVELGRRGAYTANDLASIQDILNGISSAEIAKRPSALGGRSLMGVLLRVEPL